MRAPTSALTTSASAKAATVPTGTAGAPSWSQGFSPTLKRTASPFLLATLVVGCHSIRIPEGLGIIDVVDHYPLMSNHLPTDPHAALSRVQELVGAVVPTARCELQDYEHKIGCGDMDQWDNIQDVVFVRRGTTENDVLHLARVLEVKLRTGGSTAG